MWVFSGYIAPAVNIFLSVWIYIQAHTYQQPGPDIADLYDAFLQQN
jgi:hypothetical protein